MMPGEQILIGHKGIRRRCTLARYQAEYRSLGYVILENSKEAEGYTDSSASPLPSRSSEASKATARKPRKSPKE